ncbi:hypothetical protein LXL04_018192 [Taraxacum kok-saghyz]
MASKPLISFSFSCICIAIVALADGRSISTPNFDLYSSEKANIIDCRAAYISMGDCYLETTRSYRVGQARILMGPNCCRAVQEFNSGCWPKSFGLNPFYPPILEIYCSRFKAGQPPIPSGADQVGEPQETGFN